MTKERPAGAREPEAESRGLRQPRRVQATCLKLAFLVACASFLVVSARTVSDRIAHRRACARLEAQAARLPAAPMNEGARPGQVAARKRAGLRMAELDLQLEALVPADSGLGAPRSWADDRRAELSALVDLVRPVLTEMVAVADQRPAILTGRSTTSLARSRHRTNLMCATAICAQDDHTAVRWLGDAVRVAESEDDGSVVAGVLRTAFLAITCDAAALLAKRPTMDPELLTCELEPSLQAGTDPRNMAQRVVNEIRAATQAGIHHHAPTVAVESLTRFLDELAPLLSAPRGARVRCAATDELAPPFRAWSIVMQPSYLEHVRTALRW